ncbi:MAG: SRPBCC family protein [Bacteroidota bacterium]
MFVRKFSTKLVVKCPLAEVWDFFSQPANLARLSPPTAGIRIVSPEPEQSIYPGIVVHLQMGPIPGLRLSWYSEITQIREQAYFIDDQIAGPFSLWHHEHHFRAIDEQTTEMHDILHYRVPLGPLGVIANWLFVKRQIKGIFTYRAQAISELLGPVD